MIITFFDCYHLILEQLFPKQHKMKTKTRLAGYLHGFYSESVTTYSCSCGKQFSGFWVMTGLKVPAFKE